MSFEGLIDIHGHLLPGIDDGCVSLSDSIACVERLLARGFVGSVCTPHVCMPAYPDNYPARIERRVAVLQEQLREAGLTYRLWPGGEVRITEETIAGFEEYGVPTLGPGRWVLLDHWGPSWPACGDAVIEYLLAHEYRPILAHPERMPYTDEELNAVLASLEQAGVWLQGNLRCMTGLDGPDAQRWMQKLLAENRYQLVATDVHGPEDLDDRLAGIEMVQSQVGVGRLVELLEQRPREVVLFDEAAG